MLYHVFLTKIAEWDLINNLTMLNLKYFFAVLKLFNP